MTQNPDQVRRAVEGATGHTFKDEALLRRALVHASVAEQRLDSNERMEFLGDSVLGLVVAERIYQRYPGLLEGEMTKIKSTVVSRQSCADIARAMELDRWLVLGKGMQRDNGMPQSLSAAVLESVIAAVYLDGGFDAAARFVAPLFDPLIDRAARSGHQENFKSVLQQHAQQSRLETPGYRILDEKGPDHAKAFKVCVEMGGQRYEPAWGQSKKQAEQAAALNALQELGLLEQVSDGHLRVVGGVEPAPPVPMPAVTKAPTPKPAKRKRTARAKPRKKKAASKRKAAR